MNAWTIILDIVLILISIVLIIAVLLQQGQDPLGPGQSQPGGVRAGQPARGGPPPDGGVGV